MQTQLPFDAAKIELLPGMIYGPFYCVRNLLFESTLNLSDLS